MPPETAPIVSQQTEKVVLTENIDPAVISEKIPSTLVQVDNVMYSAQELSSIHPGGDLFVKAFAGVDATEAFLSYHRRAFPHAKVPSAYHVQLTCRYVMYSLLFHSCLTLQS